MKIFLIIMISLSLCLSGCGNNENTNSSENNYEAERTILENSSNEYNEYIDNPESEISSFSTKIYTPNDSARQNNIKITCSELNETIVKSRRNIFFL